MAVGGIQRTGRVIQTSDRGWKLFEPDVLLPAQYAAQQASVARRPEQRLMLAVLEDAVEWARTAERDITDRTRTLVAEARAWIASDDHVWPFAFVNICDALGLDPNALRLGIGRAVPRRAGKPRKPASATGHPGRHRLALAAPRCNRAGVQW